MKDHGSDYEYFKRTSDYINSVTANFKPEIGLILGSGLGGFAEKIDIAYEVPYSEIPDFPVSTAPGHRGRFVFGTAGGRRIVCMAGRFHYYEGYEFDELRIPVYVLKMLGVKTLILTNAAGGINTSYNVGDIMLITDHIMLMGWSPLRGENIEEFGTRFPDCSRIYSLELREIALEAAEGSGLTVHEGVYFYFQGPQFETPAEIRAARVLGGDAAGMSTVTEAITAAHCGLPVLAFSFISNMASGMLDKPLSGADVNAAAEKTGPLLEKYLRRILERI